MYKFRRCFWVVCLLLCPAVATAQNKGALSNLLRRNPTGEVSVIVDTPSAAIPRPVEVTNGTRVTITGKKSPIDTCTVATKREEIKPEPNPLGQFIKIFMGIPVVASDTESLPTGCPDGVNGPDDNAKRITSALDSLKRNVDRSGNETREIYGNYIELGNRISKFVNCKKLDDSNICSDLTTFKDESKDLQKAVATLLKGRLPQIESVELQMALLKKLLEERLKTPSPSPTKEEQMWLDNVNSRFDCMGSHIASIRQIVELLKVSRADLEKFDDLITTHQSLLNDDTSATTYRKVLPEDNNAKVSGTVTCVNYFTKQVSVESIPFTVTYQDIPRASVTVGILFTTLNKRQVGAQAVRTGTTADGATTFRNNFAETDRSEFQLVPFSFFNVYLSGTPRININLTGGIGANPNNGKTQAEFFVGGALGFKNVYVQFGGHIGRWQELGGGFGFGETVPANFPGVQVERRYTMRLGRRNLLQATATLGINYRAS